MAVLAVATSAISTADHPVRGNSGNSGNPDATAAHRSITTVAPDTDTSTAPPYRNCTGPPGRFVPGRASVPPTTTATAEAVPSAASPSADTPTVRSHPPGAGGATASPVSTDGAAVPSDAVPVHSSVSRVHVSTRSAAEAEPDHQATAHQAAATSTPDSGRITVPHPVRAARRARPR
jgi:hypothetical protein